jgi:hypothetical protein
MSTPDPLTVEEFKAALPEKFKKGVNQDLIDRINATLSKPELFEQYRNDLLSYTRVMQDGKFKIEDYINAVKYVGFKVMGCTNIDAYSRTFPERIERFHDEEVSPKDIASYVTAYNKGILVNKLMEQTLVPTHILNQDLFQQAINTQAEIMLNEKISPKVRSDAANSLMTHLKPPEKTRIELDIKQTENSVVMDLKSTLAALAAQQRQIIQMGGATARDMAHSKIIDITPDPLELEHDRTE